MFTKFFLCKDFLPLFLYYTYIYAYIKWQPNVMSFIN